MKFRFIEEHRDAFCAKRMCDVLDVSDRGLRAYRSRPASQRQRTDMIVLAHIQEQSRLSLGSYGRPRMTEELKELGLNIGHRRVGRLMRENGIRVERSKKFKVTTDSNHAFNIAPNLLNRDFHADGPNQKWAGDISYIWTREGWLYLAIILDLHSRRVIGWAVSNRMKRDLALRQPPKGCIHHTDRGSQGGFSRSSQRFLNGGCDGKPQTRFCAKHSRQDGITRPPASGFSFSAGSVLAAY